MSLANNSASLDLHVLGKTPVADGVISLEIAAPDGRTLPEWSPGSHLELRLPSGLRRQYSLCGDPTKRTSYTVCVLREDDGRGGSAEVHDRLAIGDSLTVTGPRNNFPLADAPDHLLLAGGIGVTPLKAMLDELDRRGDSWRLVYGGRSRDTMAFLDELVEAHPEKVTIVPQDEAGVPDFDHVVSELSCNTHIYCCGPPPMLTAATDACTRAGISDRLHTERFTADGAAPDPCGTDEFEVELRASGITLTVPAEQSMLETIRDELPSIDYSCSEGYCGTCETRVLEGQPEHRGTLLSPEEHDEEGTMLICVGRSQSSRLVLDL